jgi:hypothetical protein
LNRGIADLQSAASASPPPWLKFDHRKDFVLIKNIKIFVNASFTKTIKKKYAFTTQISSEPSTEIVSADVSSCGLKISVFTSILTPQLYQTVLLTMSLRRSFFGVGFELRCFQLLSISA